MHWTNCFYLNLCNLPINKLCLSANLIRSLFCFKVKKRFVVFLSTEMQCAELFDNSSIKCDVITCNNSCCPNDNDPTLSHGYRFCRNIQSNAITSDYCMERASQVTNPVEAESFLNNITFTVQNFIPCPTACNNTLCLLDHSNVQSCVTNTTEIFFENAPCSNYSRNSDCDLNRDQVTESLLDFPPLFFFFGVLAVIGNSSIIFSKIRFFFSGFDSNQKERIIFHFLILNLAISDFIMGLSYIIYASEILYLKHNEQEHIHSIKCDVLGIFGFLSNQTSITILVLISGYRLLSVTRPFNRVHLKATVFLVGLMWVIWVVIAIIPIIGPLSGSFFDGIYIHGVKTDYISFPFIREFLNNILNNTNASGCFRNILEVIKSNDNHRVLLKFVEKLNVANGAMAFQGFYNKHPVLCTASPVVEPNSASSVLTITILSIDLVAIIFVIGAYACIFKLLLRQQSLRETFLELFECSKKNTKKSITSRRRIRENKKLYRSILGIVMTNLFVWVPTLIAAITYYGMAVVSSQLTDNFTVPYQLFVFFAFPVNSVINPFLYSSSTWSRMCKKIQVKSSRVFTHTSDNK